ncbi:hypothetical protein [Variovorax sp. LT1R16]|uniref:hypothetical protein n=1 Tax=Variovorax sp. LT1R16 TaxID=3443728 RepID=UPI003F449E08
MHPVNSEDFAIDSDPRPLWQSLRDLALSLLVVAAIALITAFLTATSAPLN